MKRVEICCLAHGHAWLEGTQDPDDRAALLEAIRRVTTQITRGAERVLVRYSPTRDSAA